MATVIPVSGELLDIPNPGGYSEALTHFPEWVVQGGAHTPWSGSLEASKTESSEVFLHRSPESAANEGWLVNPRAQKFLSQRGLPVLVRGTVLYLSAEEWKAFLPPSPPVGSPVAHDSDFQDFLKTLIVPVAAALPPDPNDDSFDSINLAAELMKKARETQKWVALHGDTFPSKEAIKHRFGGRYNGEKMLWSVPEHLAVEAQAHVDAHGRRKAPPVQGDSQSAPAPFSPGSPFKFAIRCRKCMREIQNWKAKEFSSVPECPKEDEEACLAAEQAELEKLPF